MTTEPQTKTTVGPKHNRLTVKACNRYTVEVDVTYDDAEGHETYNRAVSFEHPLLAVEAVSFFANHKSRILNDKVDSLMRAMIPSNKSLVTSMLVTKHLSEMCYEYASFHKA